MPAACPRPEQSARRSREHFWRSGDDRLDVAEHLFEQLRPRRRAQTRAKLSSVPSRQQAEPAARARPNSRATPSGGRSPGSSITTSVGTKGRFAGCAVVSGPHDRARSSARQRQPVGFEAEVADGAVAHGLEQVERRHPGHRMKPPSELGLGEDRKPIAGATQTAALARIERVEVVEQPPGLRLVGDVASEELQARGSISSSSRAGVAPSPAASSACTAWAR